MNNINISLVIPCYENFNSFKKSFSSAINQKYKPEQIIIIDSSKVIIFVNTYEKNNFEIYQLKLYITMKKIYIQESEKYWS